MRMRSILATTIMLALMSGAALAAPEVLIRTDKASYTSKEVPTIYVTMSDTGATVYDLYIAVLPPAGTQWWYYSFFGWSRASAGDHGTHQPHFSVAPGRPWCDGVEFNLPAANAIFPAAPSLADILSEEGTGGYMVAAALTPVCDAWTILQLPGATFDLEEVEESIYYVNTTTGRDSYDGLTESTAWQTIAHALKTVDGSEAKPVTVRVAAGMYSATRNGEKFPLGMESWMSLVGEASASTILDAGGNATHVFVCDSVHDATIEGFTITGGSASGGTSISDLCGGGLYLEESSLTIRGNTIWNNESASQGGGGICCYNCTATIQGNTIAGNDTTGNGGGILATYYSTPTIEGNVIIDNTAQLNGGGVHCYNYSPAVIEDNIIFGNMAGEDGGGIGCTENSSPVICSNTIESNVTDWHGGGIYCFHSSEPAVEYNTISDNSTERGSGAGIFCDGCSPVILGNTFERNSAHTSGGAIACYHESSPTIQDNTIALNTTESDGGAIHCYNNSSPDIFNNCVVENSAQNGGAAFQFFSECSPTVRNNTVVGNSAFMYGTGITAGSSSEPIIIDCIIWGNGDDLSNCSATYCCIEDGDAGVGNIHDEPQFVVGPFGDYYLAPTSPCVNMGSQSAVNAGLDERTTQADGTLDTGTVDMGYHYPVP